MTDFISKVLKNTRAFSTKNIQDQTSKAFFFKSLFCKVLPYFELIYISRGSWITQTTFSAQQGRQQRLFWPSLLPTKHIPFFLVRPHITMKDLLSHCKILHLGTCIHHTWSECVKRSLPKQSKFRLVNISHFVKRTTNYKIIRWKVLNQCIF